MLCLSLLGFRRIWACQSLLGFLRLLGMFTRRWRIPRWWWPPALGLGPLMACYAPGVSLPLTWPENACALPDVVAILYLATTRCIVPIGMPSPRRDCSGGPRYSTLMRQWLTVRRCKLEVDPHALECPLVHPATSPTKSTGTSHLSHPGDSKCSVPPPENTTSFPRPLRLGFSLKISRFLQSSSLIMANFVADPRPFIPHELVIDDGGNDRHSRARVHLVLGQEARRDDFVIATDVEGVIPPLDTGMWMLRIRDFIENDLHLHVLNCAVHPFGLGIFELGSLLQKDRLLTGDIYNVEGTLIRFIRQDIAQNFREIVYTRKGWILMLGFPVTYINDMCIHQVVASFGKLLRWHNSPRIKSYVLVKCLYISASEVSILLLFGDDNTGKGCSWSIPVYILTPDDD
jgi:hypothetical protein